MKRIKEESFKKLFEGVSALKDLKSYEASSLSMRAVKTNAAKDIAEAKTAVAVHENQEYLVNHIMNMIANYWPFEEYCKSLEDNMDFQILDDERKLYYYEQIPLTYFVQTPIDDFEVVDQ